MTNLIKAELLSILLILFSIYTTAAQSTHDSTLCKVDKAYIKSIGSDFGNLIISPLKWSKNEQISAVTIIGTAALLYSQDEQIAVFWGKHQSTGLDKVNQYFFDPYGKMYFTIPLMGAFYIYGASSNKTKPKRVAMDFVQASFYSIVIVNVIKQFTHRHRPYQTDPLNPYLWDGPFTSNYSHTSFPSGHTIEAFTFAAVIGTHYKKTLWVPIVAYSLAVLEGASRMYSNKHWSTDVLISGALGYAIGTFTVNRNHCKLKALPIISTNYSGLQFSYSLH